MWPEGGGSGFTLIELSIVLVIIGLIVGGVLVGRDLIQASEVRRTVAQYEQFNTAANAFKLKYNCLPGDCADAVALGFDGNSAGNGDGLIGPCDGTVDSSDPCFLADYYLQAIREYLNFWYHLGAAGLISFKGVPTAFGDTVLGDPNFDSTTDPAPNSVSVADVEKISDKLGYEAGLVTPPARIRARGARFGWLVRGALRFTAPNTSSFSGGNPAVKALPAHNLVLGKSVVGLTMTRDIFNSFPPADIAAMDRKLDDGLPLSGKMQVYESKYYATGDAHAQAFTDDFFGCEQHPPATGPRCTCHNGGGGAPATQWIYSERSTPVSRLCVAVLHGTF